MENKEGVSHFGIYDRTEMTERKTLKLNLRQTSYH